MTIRRSCSTLHSTYFLITVPCHQNLPYRHMVKYQHLLLHYNSNNTFNTGLFSIFFKLRSVECYSNVECIYVVIQQKVMLIFDCAKLYNWYWMPSSKIVQVEHDTLCHHPALSAQHPNFPFWFNVSTGPVLDQHLGSILQSLDHTSLSVCRAGLSLVKFTGDRSSPTQLTLSSLSLLLPTSKLKWQFILNASYGDTVYLELNCWSLLK